MHQSTAQHRGDAGEEKETDAAFEFLHNTFGEFLVGHFLITQLLRRTRELYKLRNDPELADRRNMTLADPNGLKPAWYVSLMQAPLFARPVIVKLMSEWFPHALSRTGHSYENVITDFDDVLRHEIARAIGERQFARVIGWH